jgi:hypothetical protein
VFSSQRRLFSGYVFKGQLDRIFGPLRYKLLSIQMFYGNVDSYLRFSLSQELRHAPIIFSSLVRNLLSEICNCFRFDEG